jgi:hypothetical protein
MADDVKRNEPARYPSRYGVHLSNVINRVSWGAVWAGAIIALSMEALLTLFGLFIGFGMYNSRAANFWVIWCLVTAGWSMFFGAWCASRLSGNPVREAGVLHGITTWGLVTVATMAILIVSAWSVLREGVNVLSTAAIAGAELAPAAIHQAPPSQLSQSARQTGEAVNQPQNPGRSSQGTADIISGLSLRTFASVLLGFIMAILGGSLGRPRSVIIEEQQFPVGPTRVAA